MSDYIEKALSESDELLTVIDFIKVTKFPIDAFMIDRFWNTMEEDQLIYVDEELIRWMGYSCAAMRDRKCDFIGLSSSCDEKYYDNKQYTDFLLRARGLAPDTYPPLQHRKVLSI